MIKMQFKFTSSSQEIIKKPNTTGFLLLQVVWHPSKVPQNGATFLTSNNMLHSLIHLIWGSQVFLPVLLDLLFYSSVF